MSPLSPNLAEVPPVKLPFHGSAALARRRPNSVNGGMSETIVPIDSSPDPSRMFDGLLVRVAQQRDRAAFRAVYDHYTPRLRAYMMRLGADGGRAEELTQEVLLLIWRRAETFDPSQASANTWIYTIARNRRIDALRSEKRPEFELNDPALVPQGPMQADDSAQAEDEARRLHAAIADLPAEQAELLQLAYFEGKPHSIIAAERGLPLGTVKSRLRLAMGKLRSLLKDLS